MLDLWLFLQNEPVFWLTATLLAYQAGVIVYKKSNFLTICAPFVIASCLILPLVLCTGTTYETYLSGAHFIDFLLGPATVALAVPVFDQRKRLARLWPAVLIGVSVGAITGIVSTIFLGAIFGASFETVMTLAAKSVTTPIAIGIAEKMGGIPEFTAAIVVLTGIAGALIATPLYRLFGIKKDFTMGLALGVSAHGMGTSRAFQISNEAGAFSGLAIGLTGLATAFLAPLIAPPLIALLLAP